jgi:hypothetical protein
MPDHGSTIPLPNAAHLAALRHAVAAPTPDPAAGQIWKATWDRITQLILLIDVSDTTVTAAPVSPDAELADDAAVVLSEDMGPFAYDVVVWLGLATDLPIRTLELLLGDVTEEGRGLLAGDGGAGAPITHPLDERAQLRDAIAERMDTLGRATWVPEAVEPVDLLEASKAKGFTLSKLAPLVDLEPGDLLALFRRDRAITHDVASRLGPLLGLEEEALTGSHQIDPDLVWAFDRPSLRRPLRERAAREGYEDEAAFRVHVATSELAFAARQTATRDPRDRYLGLIRVYLDES